jgi:hypothetical protein
MLKKPAFPLDPAAVAGERTVGPNYTVTWHNNSNRIGTIGKAYGPNGGGPANLARKLRIGHRDAQGDLSQRIPYVALKGGACRPHRQSLNRRKISGKVAADCLRQPVRVASRLEIKSIRAIVKPQQAEHPRLMIGPIDGSEISILVRHKDQLADRCIDSIN